MLELAFWLWEGGQSPRISALVELVDRTRLRSVGTLLVACLPSFLLVGSVLLLNRDFQQRNLSWDGGMGAPIAAQAYDSSGVLKGGKVLQPPPPGTLSRSASPALAFLAGKAEAERAGRELPNPFQPTQAHFNRGKVVYERVCATCHGRRFTCMGCH